MTIMEELERFLLTEIATDLDKDTIEPDDDLLEQGIVDSMGVVALITFMEEAFGIEIAEEDVIPENFQTLESMSIFVEQKMHDKQLTVAV